MKKPLPLAFFSRKTTRVARDLLGCVIARRIGRKTRRAVIIETEAYDGLRDKASHARRGQTKRNAPMFGAAGRWYIYLVYGLHWMVNIVTREAGHPAAVLIRGLKTQSGRRISGPGKVSRFIGLRKSAARALQGKPAGRETGFWIEAGKTRVPLHAIRRAPRVGIPYAGAWRKKLWRFMVY